MAEDGQLEDETLGQKVSEKLRGIIGDGAVGLIAALLGAVCVALADTYLRVNDHDQQFSRIWTKELHDLVANDIRLWSPSFHEQLTDDIGDIQKYISTHEAYRQLYVDQTTEFRASVEARIKAQESECHTNWNEVGKRLRELEQRTAVLQSKIDGIKPWSLSK